MNDFSCVELLKKIYHISLQLLSLAEEENWDSFTSVIEKRNTLLHLINQEKHFTLLSQAMEGSEIANYLIEIKRINGVLEESANLKRDNLMSELRQQSQASKAIDAYRQ
jgi:flagellar protein FliT